MKRSWVVAGSGLVLCTIAGWVIGTSSEGSMRHAGHVLTLLSVSLLIGLAVSVLTLESLRFLLTRRRPAASVQVRRSFALTETMVGAILALFANRWLEKSVRSLFGPLDQSFHLLTSQVGGWLGLVVMISALVTVSYVLPIIYEELIGHRSRKAAPVVLPMERLGLLAKLSFGGVIVWLLTLSTMTSDWVTGPQYFMEMRGGYVEEPNDSMTILTLVLPAMSDASYLEGILRVVSEVNRLGSKVSLVALPRELERSPRVRKLTDELVRQRVVFAVPPKPTENDRDRWVQRPSEAFPRDRWGVASAQPSPGWNSMRFFPFEYAEEDSGYPVPDAVFQVLRTFQESQTAPIVRRSEVFFGNYSLGLFEDGSAPVVRKLAFWQAIRGEASWNAEVDSVWFSFDGRILPSLPEDVRKSFADRIVIIDQPRTPSWTRRGESYGMTAAVIIHQIVRGHSYVPIDGWTPWLSLFFLLAGIVLMAFTQPIIAAIILFVFAIAQPFAGSWLLSHMGYLFEIMPPILTTLWCIPVLLFVRILHELRRTVLAERKRAEEELQTAHEMQMGLMPAVDPVVPGFDVSGISRPAKEVGGDFFDYVWLDEKKTKLGIALADVSGKAMKAALTAVMTSGMVYREAGSNETPKSILRKINRPMYLKTSRSMFTAMCFAVLETKRRFLRLSNAGQAYPILLRKGKTERLKVDGERLPLGVKEESNYQERSIRLRKDDLLIFYTDGVTESMSAKGEMLGEDRWEDIVRSVGISATARQIVEGLFDRISQHSEGAIQHDDMTIVLVKVLS